MVDPYLSDLVLASLSVESQYTGQFIKDLIEHLAPSSLIKLIKETYRQATHPENYCRLFRSVAQKGVGDSLNKTLLSFTNRWLLQYLSIEESPASLVQLQGDIFV
jgi:hypothetical protein